MDIYARKSKWKVYLVVAGLLIVLISVLATNYLSGKLANEERSKVETYLTALERINDPQANPDCDVTLHFQIISSNTTIPVILVGDTDIPTEGLNFGPALDTNITFLTQEVEELKAAGIPPIEGTLGQKVYYKSSNLLKLLRYFPIFQFILVVAFILFGYFTFSAARRAEQNQVWVGMAKETAHQLGTPISAILGWIEHLKFLKEDDEDMIEVVEELTKDVNRLELVADRFSKIGAEPVLDSVNIFEELEDCRAYMQRRSPRKVSYEFPAPNQQNLIVNINPPLFDWVIENLLRNALDAMGGKGKISAEVYEDGNYIAIDISDTGKGIPSNKLKTVFQPGYTTKKRGWGLGLSLAKRIIEEYHSGKIFVKKSVENVGTTFTIKLPKSLA